MGHPFAYGPTASASRPASNDRRPPTAGLKGCGPAGCDVQLVVGRFYQLRTTNYELLGVQLDDELLLHGQVDLLARRERQNLPGLLAGVEGEPARDAPALHLFDRVRDGRILLARAAHRDEVARAHR